MASEVVSQAAEFEVVSGPVEASYAGGDLDILREGTA
jgi:hypothetical protein